MNQPLKLIGLAGATDADNPYKMDSDEAMDWEDGFSSAADQEELS